MLMFLNGCYEGMCSVFAGMCSFTLHQISFAHNETKPKNLCNRTYVKNDDSRKRLNFLRERIHESYMHQWVIDNMPVTWCYSVMESDRPFCTTHFPVGCFVTKEGVRHDACYLSVRVVLQCTALDL